MNLQNIVLIGPGSEWFWTAAQFVAVVISLVAIYGQLKAQSGANFVQRMEALQARWDSPRMAYCRLELALHLRYQEPDPACYLKAMPLLDFFADLYNMEVEGHIRINEIAANWNRSIQEWVAFTEALVRDRREATNNPLIYDLEPLLEKLRGWEKKRGMPPLDLDEAGFPVLLDEAIGRNRAVLVRELAWGEGQIPDLPTAPRPARVRDARSGSCPRRSRAGGRGPG